MEANLRRILEEQQRQTSSTGASDSEPSGRSATQSEQQSLLAQGQQLLQMSQRQLTQQTLTAPRLPQLDLPPPKQRKAREVSEPPRGKRRKHDGQAFPGEMPAMPSERARAIANGSWGTPSRVPKVGTPPLPQQGSYSPRAAMAAPQYVPSYGMVQVQQPPGGGGHPLQQRGWPLMQQAQPGVFGQMPTPGYGPPGEEGQAPVDGGYDSPRHRQSKGSPGASNLGEGLARRHSQAALAQDGTVSGSHQPGAPYDEVVHGVQAQAPPEHPTQAGPVTGPALDVQENPSEPGDGSEGPGDMWAQQEVHLWLNDSDQMPPGSLNQWEEGGATNGSGGSDGLGNRRRALRANA